MVGFLKSFVRAINGTYGEIVKDLVYYALGHFVVAIIHFVWEVVAIIRHYSVMFVQVQCVITVYWS